ncbi:hypothetical protein CLAIMM_08768 isoform 2 [Cladophialophora immunda]|nr:hypothetical protein CLAIMM_08768 isoform 2 [Cladophialophora immunda]
MISAHLMERLLGTCLRLVLDWPGCTSISSKQSTLSLRQCISSRPKWKQFLRIEQEKFQGVYADRFTTDYYLPDGSYGSISSGNYTTPNGDYANLITGSYRLANGQTGNIYQGDTLEEPNTSTLPMPTPWTSKGVGSAIPASEVGAQPTSNFSSIPPLPTLTTSSAGTDGSDLATMTTLSGSNTTWSSTPPPSIPTKPPQPSITPPITNIAFRQYLNGLNHLWTMIMTIVAVTLLVSHE